MKKILLLLAASLLLLTVACASTTITWTPKGGPTAELGLRTKSSPKGLYLAVRSVDGQFQANPWTFYVPPKNKGQSPKVLGPGKDANVVILDANTEYEFSIGFYMAKGLLAKAGSEWREEQPTITIKALKPDTKYYMSVENASPAIPPTPGEVRVGIITLRGKSLGNLGKPIQQWEITGITDPNAKGLLQEMNSYTLKEVTPGKLL